MRVRIEPHESSRFNAQIVLCDLPAVCSALGRTLTAVQAGSASAPASSAGSQDILSSPRSGP